MSFVDNIKSKRMEKSKEPFIGTQTPETPKTATPVLNNAPKMPPHKPSKPGMPAPKKPMPPKQAAPAKPISQNKEEDAKEKVLEETDKNQQAPIQDNANKEIDVVKDLKEEKEKEQASETSAANTKKRTNRSVSKKKASPVEKTENTSEESDKTEDSTNEANMFFNMPNTTVSFDEAIKAIRYDDGDNEFWTTFRPEIIEELDNCPIESDMQDGAVKKLIAKLDAIRTKIWVQYCDTKNLLDEISNSNKNSNRSTEGLMERLKYLNCDGSNDILRKKNGIVAVMSYKHPGTEGNINLYQVYDAVKRRVDFLESVMDTIDFKRGVLITFTGNLKLEKAGK
jgi:hypothetical protein